MQQRSTTNTLEAGDVVLVAFQFRNEPDPEVRPAIVVSTRPFHESRLDTVIVAVSTRTDREYYGDCLIEDLSAAGLDRPSKSKGIFRTVEQRVLRRTIGHLSHGDLQRLQNSLRNILDL